jgi:hypothetical protein
LTAKRIQRTRKKGHRAPEDAVYVGQPSKWGNPFKWEENIDFTANEAQAKAQAAGTFRQWLNGGVKIWPIERRWILEHLPELRGKDLACWCALDQPCHADVLLELANGEPIT